MKDLVHETAFKEYVKNMSNTNKKAKELSTKDDKLIKSTLFLLQDNKNKLHLIIKLKGVTNFIEGLVLDNDRKLDVA